MKVEVARWSNAKSGKLLCLQAFQRQKLVQIKEEGEEDAGEDGRGEGSLIQKGLKTRLTAHFVRLLLSPSPLFQVL